MVHAELEEAKTQLSSLIAQVEAGEEVILARAGKPVARIVRWSEPAKAKRQLGLLSGWIVETTGVWDEGDDLVGLMAKGEPSDLLR